MSSIKLRKDFAALVKFIAETQGTDEETIIPDNNENIEIALTTSLSNMNDFVVVILGPKSSPYEGGKYRVRIQVSNNYPFCKPNVVFLTRICHPHIHEVSGSICIETLGSGWGPNVGLLQVLMSIYGMLFSPNNHDTKEVTSINEKDIELHKKYIKKVSEHTEKYAKTKN